MTITDFVNNTYIDCDVDAIFGKGETKFKFYNLRNTVTIKAAYNEEYCFNELCFHADIILNGEEYNDVYVETFGGYGFYVKGKRFYTDMTSDEIHF